MDEEDDTEEVGTKRRRARDHSLALFRRSGGGSSGVKAKPGRVRLSPDVGAPVQGPTVGRPGLDPRDDGPPCVGDAARLAGAERE